LSVVEAGIVFTERRYVEGARYLDALQVEISRQNANLATVRKRLAEQAKAKGANCVGGFEYGQRAHHGVELLLPKWDTESWYGTGDALFLPDEILAAIQQRTNGTATS
jgi:hypothetical protein